MKSSRRWRQGLKRLKVTSWRCGNRSLPGPHQDGESRHINRRDQFVGGCFDRDFCPGHVFGQFESRPCGGICYTVGYAICDYHDELIWCEWQPYESWSLDFGLIVDGAVIIVEAVMHQLSHSKHYKDVERLTSPNGHRSKNGGGQDDEQCCFGQVIILIVYLPIFALQGHWRQDVWPMAQTVTFALIGAFILSPYLCAHDECLGFGKKIKHTPTLSDRVMLKIEILFQRTLEFLLSCPNWFVGSAFVLFVISLFILTRLGGEFIPALEEGDFSGGYKGAHRKFHTNNHRWNPGSSPHFT